MGWKVVFAPQAHARLEQIVRYIAQDDPQAAIRRANIWWTVLSHSRIFQNWARRTENDRICVDSCVNRI